MDAHARELLAISARRWDALRESQRSGAPSSFSSGSSPSSSTRRTPSDRAGYPPVAAAEVSGRQTGRRPGVAGEPIPIPLGLLNGAAEAVRRTRRGRRRGTATHIRDAIANGSMEAGSLLTASLARNQ